jgi:hypothetical protein
MKQPMSLRLVLLLVSFCSGFFASAQTVASLWAEYTSNPNNHPNIPNNSYAGYGAGTVAIPSPAYTVYNVTAAPYNAIPGDANDDQPAIQAAIDAAGLAGSGIVYIPAGTYFLNKPLYIKYNKVIVRGQGSTGATATILDFRFSTYSMFKADVDAGAVGPGGLWWASGLVWIGPSNTFKANGAPDMFTDYEHWRTTSTLATITAASDAGTFSVTVNSTASLSVGMKLLLTIAMPSDRSFIKLVHGHTPTEAGIDNDTYVGDCTNIKSPGEQNYYWPAVIKSIAGNVVTFDRPLRLRVNPAQWAASLRSINGLVTESGIENVQIMGHNVNSMAHLPAPTSNATGGGTSLGGWNGLYINRSWNCWANNIRFVNLENGAIFSAAKNCSVLNTFVTSTGTTRWYHHPFALRVYSSDNLVENFTVDGPNKVYHGINAEWFSSGNVYSKGLMKVGTFDSHRGSAFDQIRTEITVANDAGSAPGGNGTSGPFAGKRFAHWNITQQIQAGYAYSNSASRNGNDVYEPLQFPMGTFVGISGTRDGSNGEFVPPPVSGSTGSVEVAATITDPSLTNLYHAELNFRKSMSILPIKLLGFEVKKSTEGKALISWTVAEPEAGDQFFLQWSNNAIHFNDIDHQQVSPQRTTYQYTHAVSDWSHNQYYRLKTLSNTGNIIYSSIKTLSASRTLMLSLYPNPIRDQLNIRFSRMVDDRSTVRIINMMGQTVKTVQSEAYSVDMMSIDVKDLQQGQYIIEASTKDEQLRKLFLKQ